MFQARRQASVYGGGVPAVEDLTGRQLGTVIEEMGLSARQSQPVPAD